jgi:hypothetical protein
MRQTLAMFALLIAALCGAVGVQWLTGPGDQAVVADEE